MREEWRDVRNAWTGAQCYLGGHCAALRRESCEGNIQRRVGRNPARNRRSWKNHNSRIARIGRGVETIRYCCYYGGSGAAAARRLGARAAEFAADPARREPIADGGSRSVDEAFRDGARREACVGHARRALCAESAGAPPRARESLLPQSQRAICRLRRIRRARTALRSSFGGAFRGADRRYAAVRARV